MAIHALHGFLGLPQDWEDIIPSAQAPNLFEGEITPFDQWAESFNNDKHGILVGYSMGGRLALHALLQNPSKWEKAIIISGYPGHKDLIERQDRLNTDIQWSQRFLTDSWDVLMNDWNQQAVLNSIVQRNESDYTREALSKAILTWSVGYQNYLLPEIEKLDMPILWITGEKDTKYTSVDIKFKNPESKKAVAPDAGHRVPWQNKKWLQQQVRSFLCQ